MAKGSLWTVAKENLGSLLRQYGQLLIISLLIFTLIHAKPTKSIMGFCFILGILFVMFSENRYIMNRHIQDLIKIINDSINSFNQSRVNISNINSGGVIMHEENKDNVKIEVQGGSVGGIAGRDFTGDAVGTQYNYTNQESSIELATEIQSILEELSSSYPTNTTTQKLVFVTEAIRIIEEEKPTLKKKIISALKAGTFGAVQQALNHPVASFVIEAIKDWQQNSN